MHRRRRHLLVARVAVVALVALAGPLAGCKSTLETGYKPRRLGSSTAERRSYYASPFTPEAREAELERDREFESRRPRPGY